MTVSKLANTLKSTLASAQKHIGKTFGNETMAASGYVNKAKAEASKLSENIQQTTRDTSKLSEDVHQTAREMGQKLQGRAERTAGAATGNKSMENKGRAHEDQSKM
ncbi:hypothetical protein BGZ73_004635 [Actinomortierella ambigua]|nr:hypothetical protein BGZ73_004635 [Actinomortierella ambigua]